MKSLSDSEIDQFLHESQYLVGTELQRIHFDEKSLQLNFYGQGKNHWFTLSLKPGNPYFFVNPGPIFIVKNLKKPLGLFLQTHFKGERLSRFRRLKDLGRVIQFEFSDDKKIEIILIPGRVNVQASSEGKSVFLTRPKELLKNHGNPLSKDQNPESLDGKSSAQNNHDIENRDHKSSPQKDQSIASRGQKSSDQENSSLQNPSLQNPSRENRQQEDFIQLWQSRTTTTKSEPQREGANELKKKRSGLKKMETRMEELQNSQWIQAGQILKTLKSLEDCPEAIVSLVDARKSLAWNIENCFAQHKKNQLKIDGTLKRMDQLQKEITALEAGVVKKKAKKAIPSLLKQADLKGRTIEFREGPLFIGRSGADNLKLLRKAKPWHFWLHIKDYPGAHGILARHGKNDPVSSQTITAAAKAVIEQSVPKDHKGRFEVIYTECRYVRPIKGAKSGQVTHSHEKILSVKV